MITVCVYLQQAGPLQELVKEQESHIADLRREVDTLRGTVSDYQKEVDRLRVMADDEVLTREKFNDIASAHRRLLDEVNFFQFIFYHFL